MFRRGVGNLTINRLDDSRVLVVLGGKDMSDFALDFSAMNLSDSHSRKILLRLTRLACRKSGIDTQGRRLNIEALQMGEGCYLLVTVRHAPRRYRPKRGGGLCFRFAQSGDFLGAVEALYRARFYSAKNAAYEWDGAYFLCFDYPSVPLRARRVLSEFADKSGGALLCAQVKEQGKMLCARNAVAVIGAALI